MIITGLGAALLFAGSVNAQEITNTEFNDGPNVTAFAQPTQSVSAQVTPASTPVMNEFEAMSAVATISVPPVSDDGALASSEIERWAVAGILFMGLVVILFYCASELNALAELKRANNSLRARTAARMSARAV
jgi:predicted metal-binding membrane protein